LAVVVPDAVMALRTYQRGVRSRNVVEAENADACVATVMMDVAPIVFDTMGSVTPAFGPPVM
jgi:hypothetical protein